MKIYKRIPELNYIIEAVITVNTNIKREFRYDASGEVYECPICFTKFKSKKIDDNIGRNYLRKSSQARRHYNRRSCVSRSTLVTKGYLKNDLEEIKRKIRYKVLRNNPHLSTAIEYLLGLGRFKLKPIQYTVNSLIKGDISLRVSYTPYIPLIERKVRVCMSQLLGTDRRRRVPILLFPVSISKELDMNILDEPKLESREDVEYFVRNRLSLMSKYFLSKHQMRYFPSFYNSETQRTPDIELNEEKNKYLEIVDPNNEGVVYEEPMVGLLSQNWC